MNFGKRERGPENYQTFNRASLDSLTEIDFNNYRPVHLATRASALASRSTGAGSQYHWAKPPVKAISPDDDWWPPIAHRAAASAAQRLSDLMIQAWREGLGRGGGKLLKGVGERNFSACDQAGRNSKRRPARKVA